MSRFGGNSATTDNARFGGYNPFRQEIVFQRQNHWELLRNNIDLIIQNSNLLREKEMQLINEASPQPSERENSRCHEIEIIYECADVTEPVNKNPIAEPQLVDEPIQMIIEEISTPATTATEILHAEEHITTSLSKRKKRMDFASVVFKYRNELARRKHKELQDSC